MGCGSSTATGGRESSLPNKRSVPASADSFFPPQNSLAPPNRATAGSAAVAESQQPSSSSPARSSKVAAAVTAKPASEPAVAQEKAKKKEAYVPPPAIGYEEEQEAPTAVGAAVAPAEDEASPQQAAGRAEPASPQKPAGSPPGKSSASKKASSYVPPAPIHFNKSAASASQSASTATPVHANASGNKPKAMATASSKAGGRGRSASPDASEEAESLDGSLGASDHMLVQHPGKDGATGGGGAAAGGGDGDDSDLDILGGVGGDGRQDFSGLEFSKGTLEEFEAAVPTPAPKAESRSLLSGDMATLQISSTHSRQHLHEPPLPNSTSGMRFDELYRLKGVLGTGAFSTVREGYHRASVDFSYAVKCVNRKKLSEEDETALLDEVGILKELNHVHIIRLYDFFEEPSTYYLVLERMRGGELFDRIVAKAYYNEKEARDTCKILLEAVKYCHDRHIAHRDLKPENLLLLSENDDSAVKIADFGFAKKVLKKNSLTTQCGTPGYVAPEILEGTPYDERADMWSVGVILYILLGGYPPFIESTQRDLFRKIRKGEYEFHEEYWGTVSSEAKDLISSLLTVDANKRLTAGNALENPWITGDDAKLANKDLGVNLQKFRNFNAKRKFRAAVNSIIAVNKLNSLKEEFFTSLKETSVQLVTDRSQSGRTLNPSE